MTVVVSNELTWQSVPPGFVQDTPGGRRQTYYHDFFNYAGLHRPVWLYCTPPAYLSDVTIVTGLVGRDGDAGAGDLAGTVDYRIDVSGGEGLDVRVTLTDAEGGEVASAHGATGVLSVPEVRPGRPGEGYTSTTCSWSWSTPPRRARLWSSTPTSWRSGSAPWRSAASSS